MTKLRNKQDAMFSKMFKKIDLFPQDIGFRQTFDNLRRWLEDLRDVAYNKMVILCFV